MTANSNLKRRATRAFTGQAGRAAAYDREEFQVEREFQQNLEYIVDVAASLGSMGPQARAEGEENVERLLSLALATGNGVLLARFNALVQKVFDLENDHPETRLHPGRENRDPDERLERHLRKMHHETLLAPTPAF